MLANIWLVPPKPHVTLQVLHALIISYLSQSFVVAAIAYAL